MIVMDRKPNFLFLFFLLLFFTLDVQAPISFYGTQFLGLILLLIFRFLVYPKITFQSLKIFCFIIVFLEFFCFIQNLYMKTEILLLAYQRVIFLLSIGILLYDYLILIKEDILQKVISFFISFLSIVILFQFLGFYLFNIDRSLLDLGVWLGGQESRTWYFGKWQYRPTSIMSEPAIFVGVQFGLLTIQYLINNEAKISRILGIISLMLSMSFLGLILAALFIIIVYSRNIQSYIFAGLILILFYIFSFEIINTRIVRFLSGEDGSNNVKLEALNFFISDSNIALFGYGFLYKGENNPLFYEALLDLTFYLNVFTIFGLLGGLIIFFITLFFIFTSKTKIKEKMLIGLSLIKLSNPSVLFFTFFILICIVVVKKRSYK